jgi:phage tail sheath gpL-like
MTDPFGGAKASGVALEQIFRNLQGGVELLPIRLAVMAQGATAGSFSLDKAQMLSGLQAGQTYGFGSPMHLAIDKLLPANSDGVGAIPVTAYPLDDGTTAAAGDITVGGTTQTEQKTYIVKVNEISSEPIVIPATSTPAQAVALILAGVNAVVKMPVIVTDSSPAATFTAKWKGVTGNDLVIEIEGEISGLTFTINHPTGGAGNPDVQDALDKVGSTWEVFFLNCLDIADTATLEKYFVFGQGRRQPIQPKPMWAFTGNTEKVVATAVTVCDARPLDLVNVQLVAPDSKELPFVVAARELARIAVIANDNPPTDYRGQVASGLVPGADIEQWDFTERDFALKKGSSTVLSQDGAIELEDTVTFYHPVGEDDPPYRYLVDGVKNANVTFATRSIFESDEWKGKVLIPDGQATTNPNAKRPSMAVAEVAKMIDSLALLAIVSDPETAKKTIVATINPSNPKRLDVSFTYQISGNTNQIAITATWGFYFGSVAAA